MSLPHRALILFVGIKGTHGAAARRSCATVGLLIYSHSMDPKALEASPMKAVIEELDVLRNDFRAAVESYATRIESEIAQAQATVATELARKKISQPKLRDLRDMLTLLRKFSIKPEKGRRKDLKKIDALVGDLTLMLENW